VTKKCCKDANLTLNLYLDSVIRSREEELVVGVMLDIFVDVICTKDSLDVSVWIHVGFLVFREDGESREARWLFHVGPRTTIIVRLPAWKIPLLWESLRMASRVNEAFARWAALKMSTHLENGAGVYFLDMRLGRGQLEDKMRLGREILKHIFGLASCVE
jgi:hypothetical protein